MRTPIEVNLRTPDVNLADGRLCIRAELVVEMPSPEHDPRLTARIESAVEDAGQQLKRELFKLAVEKADRDLALKAGRDGARRRGQTRYTFKTRFGTVGVGRVRLQRADGHTWVPSAHAWATPRQVCITRGLRELTCDLLREASVADSARLLAQVSGEPGLLGKTAVLEILHSEGARIAEAQQRRAAEAEADADADAETETDASAGRIGPEDLPTVSVQVDEVRVKAQACTGQKALLIYTAVLTGAGPEVHLAAADKSALFAQLGAALRGRGVFRGGAGLEVVADGARWIRDWFEGLDLAGSSMVLCWYHLAKRVSQQLSMACRGRTHREKVEGALMPLLWEGNSGEAAGLLEGYRGEVKNGKALEDLISYIRERKPYLPDYSSRREAGLTLASTRVEKFNDWSVSERCKGRGMAWTLAGAGALAVLEAARRNGELEHWREHGSLPAWPCPQAV